ncbi:MAG: multicopper oxidase domain-containing protein [FCB group bacterium]|jgi:FtsP/CotA-like multicopper oxidase with cupredoxin domain
MKPNFIFFVKSIYIKLFFILILLLNSIALHSKTPLDPTTLTKWVDSLIIPPIMLPFSTNYYEVGMYQITQKLHSQLPPTTVWAYGTSKATAHYPGYTFEVTKGVPIQVKWTNNLVDSIGNPLKHLFSVDQTLHWADPLDSGKTFSHYTGPVPTVVHLHGGETESYSDGGPLGWFTPGFQIKGPQWHQDTYTYHNSQPATTLFYHDHALGMTRLNVYAGLVGFYIIRDNNDTIASKLPKGDYEIPLAIQDKMFYTDGSLAFPDSGVNPDTHPFWNPEFFGDVILVNGTVWPHLDVEPRKYRFRVLNGSNARFYDISFSNNMPFTQIGTDGGYLPSSATMTNLLMAPAERTDLIVDFSKIPMGTNIILMNDANAPYPDGDTAVPQTTAQIIQFRVNKPLKGVDNSVTPGIMRPIPLPGNISKTRILALYEVEGDNGPLGSYLDGKMWDYTITETPKVGSSEIWKIVNLTDDAHPIHIHLVQFHLIQRQKFDRDGYTKVYDSLNPVIPVPMDAPYYTVPIEQFLINNIINPNPNEMGVKDTYVVYPEEVTTFAIKFAPQEGEKFPFDPTVGPGYVWHCHILDHEDNEMMRPYKLVDSITSVHNNVNLSVSSLGQNYPNPVKNYSVINYTITEETRVNLEIYDLLGNKITTLVDNVQSAGGHQAIMDATNFPNGVFIYKMTAGTFSDSKLFVVMK